MLNARKLKLRNSRFVVGLAFLLSISTATFSDVPEKCFRGMEREGTSAVSMHVNLQSDTCLAFADALNARCEMPNPTANFSAADLGPRLSLPRWEEIPLFAASDIEVEGAFKFLHELINARAMTSNSQHRFERAQRDSTEILGRIRRSKASGGTPKLEMAKLDLEGRGTAEGVFRLTFDDAQEALDHSKNGLRRLMGEPQLFLERSVALVKQTRPGSAPVHTSGSDITGVPAEIIIDDGVPHLIRWSSTRTVVVYAAYTMKNRPLRANEVRSGRAQIVTALKCIFEHQSSSKN